MPPRFLLLVASALLAGPRAPAADPAAAVAPPALVNARDPRIAYLGRLAFSGDDARLGFPGVTIRFRYRGPAPTLRFTAASAFCAFNLSCNGWQPATVRLPEGESELPLPSGPAPAEGWTVELVRRNESWQGVTTFRGLTLPAGCELLPPEPWPARRILVIGDSITGGEQLERLPGWDDDTPRTANAGRAFGMLLGRWLGAQVHLVSYGGRGVMRDWQGRTDVVNAPQFFELALPDDAAVRWDHSAYTPDVVLVCLGTNDLSRDLPDERAFLDAYSRFVAQVRRAHPAAALVLAESPMFGTAPDTPDRAKRDLLRRTLEAVTAARRAAGDPRVAVAPVSHYPGTARDAHPVAFQHDQIAQDLLGPLRALTGW